MGSLDYASLGMTNIAIARNEGAVIPSEAEGPF